MEKNRLGVVSMIDSFNKLADICIKNKLDIKKALEEKEKLEQALDLACEELEDLDSSLYDLYDSLDYYYETKDRYEWKEYLLESVKDDE